MASTPLAAIGSKSFAQTGKVASSHSERLQASILRMPDGNDAASSSHSVEHARVAGRRYRVPGHVLGQVPVDRTAAPGQHVGELPQRVGELLRVAHPPERSRRAPRAGKAAGTAAPRAPGTRTLRPGTLATLVFRLFWQAETERAISHRWLWGRMEGS